MYPRNVIRSNQTLLEELLIKCNVQHCKVVQIFCSNKPIDTAFFRSHLRYIDTENEDDEKYIYICIYVYNVNKVEPYHLLPTRQF